MPANEPTESVTVSVTSNGYNGSGFLAGPVGGSSQSNGNASIVACVPPQLLVLSNGNQVSQGGTTYITPAPQMPSISAFLVPAAPCTLSGNVSYSLLVEYYAAQWQYNATVPATQAFTFPEPAPVGTFYGGQIYLSWNYNGVQGTYNFNLLGQNPSTSTIAAALSGWALNIGTPLRAKIAETLLVP